MPNIFTIDSPVAPSYFSVTVPTSSGIKKVYPITTLLSGYTSTDLRVGLLTDGRVRIRGNIVVPTTFAQSVFSVPPELKPTAQRSITGHTSTNTAIVLTIGTDGVVKIPNSITGTVSLDGEYAI